MTQQESEELNEKYELLANTCTAALKTVAVFLVPLCLVLGGYWIHNRVETSPDLEELRYEHEMLRICWGAVSAPPYQGTMFTDNRGREGCYVTENGKPILAIVKPRKARDDG